MEELFDVVSKFKTYGTPAAINPLGNRRIHETFKVTTAEIHCPDYVLQRINQAVFTDVDMLMRNVVYVTNHIRSKLPQTDPEIEWRVVTFIPSIFGKMYWSDGVEYWRMMKYIPFSHTTDEITSETCYAAGKAFGGFHAMLSDLPVQPEEMLPNFHNMEFRLRQLQEAKTNNRAGRKKKVRTELDKIEKYAVDMCKAEALHREGKLKKRICHGDPKLHHILFDQNNEIICIIGLDTVMPNFIFSDFGDFLRTAANTGEEDDPVIANIYFDIQVFRAFTKGYLESSLHFLTAYEIANLPFAATLFPYMQAVRYLTDYLNGDSYYQIHYADHNLIRARAQFQLFESSRDQLPHMQEFITQYLLQQGRPE